MTFGTEWGWGADENTARQLFNTYVDAGGNFIDTADLYTNGTSETWLGKFMAERNLRDRTVIELANRLEAVSRPETQFPYSFFGDEIQGMIHGGGAVGQQPSGYAPERLIQSMGAGVS